MIIRSYKSSDRNAVRALCLATAEAGEPSHFPDQVLQADLLSRYYTDLEPHSLWIAEDNGAVAGYLTGCLDTRNFVSWVKWNGLFRTIFRMLTRNIFNLEMWRWSRARIKTLGEGGAHRDEWMNPYPAHLHINLAKEARGHGAGAALIKSFVDQCRAAGIPGVHLATRGDNIAAQTFFKKQGFEQLAMINAYRNVRGQLEPVPVMIMGRRI